MTLPPFKLLSQFLPGSDIAGRDDGRARGTCSAREVVFHVHGCLDVLAELHHHDVRHRVPVLDAELFVRCIDVLSRFVLSK